MTRGPSLVVLVGGPIVLAVGACMVWLAFFPIRATDRHLDLTSVHLKQLGAGLLIYAADNDDRFPPDMSSARAVWPALNEYVKDERAIKSENKESPEFLGNATLGGKKYKELDEKHTIVFFESAPSEGGRYVLFVEGRVKRLTETEFQLALANDWKTLEVKP